MDYIMWLLIGIFIYWVIGYIFVCLTEAYEDGFWAELKVMLFWPILMIFLMMCYIVFVVIGTRILRKK